MDQKEFSLTALVNQLNECLELQNVRQWRILSKLVTKYYISKIFERQHSSKD
ncbi:hypothetical protein [Candidatus Harpocratesius sp.]